MYRLFKEPLQRRHKGGTKAAHRRYIIAFPLELYNSKIGCQFLMLFQEKLTG
jgi:hypothetical protein